METYRDKTLLIVNTANHCRFTYQFEDLQKLYEKYSEKSLIIEGFPSDQFSNQNPENGEQTEKFCKINFGVTFPMFEIVDVNGENTHPLLKFLKETADVVNLDKTWREKC